ncbi:MAG TPA: type II toxin-antitoxin system prevent-host-death family antitoxin [Burkholderiales bacterium]|nr:type II toxin-antitoxin system prevent-host-death family antitoxin [Burkholderiales bacterium]
MQVNILEAKNQLSRLIKAALAGEEVVIASNGVPVVKLVPFAQRRKTGGWGQLRRYAANIDSAFTPQADAEVAHALEGDE